MWELTQSDIDSWIKVMATFRPYPANITTKNSHFGVKNNVEAIFKMCKGMPQVNFRYGQRWYPFNVVSVKSREEAQGLINMNLKYHILQNSIENVIKAEKIIKETFTEMYKLDTSGKVTEVVA